MTPDGALGLTIGRPASLGWFLLVGAGLLAMAGAGWYGYRQQSAALTASSTAAPLRTPPAASGPASAVGSAPVVLSPPRVKVGKIAANAPVAAGAASAPAAPRWPLWEFQLRQPIPPRDPPLTPPPWRLIGATMSSDGWKVVVTRQGAAAPEYFGVGAVLPGGYKIRAITEEDVTFDINKREVILSYTGSR